MDTELPRYHKVVNEWNDYKAYIVELTSYNEAVSCWTNARDSIIVLHSEKEDHNRKLQEIKDEHHRLEGFIQYQDRWRKGLQEHQRINDQWKQYNSRKHKHEVLKGYQDIISLKPIWEKRKLYKDLEDSLKEINEKLVYLEEKEVLQEKYQSERIQWTEREETLETNKALHSAWIAHVSLKKKVKCYQINEVLGRIENFVSLTTWMIILDNQDFRIAELKLLEELKDMRKIHDQFTRDVSIFKDRAKIVEEHQKTAELYNKYDFELTKVYVALCQLDIWFKEYEQWIYDTQVIPILLEQTNMIVCLLYPENLCLHAEPFC
ncbi:MAG: hypothetical protein WD512_09995, partial [Candidatus Paceibacterota bacterium]